MPQKNTPDFSGDRGLYALEKLSEAVHALATSAGRVQERLFEAAIFLHRIEANMIADEELRRMVVGIKDDLTFDEPVQNEGRIAATLGRLSDEDASLIAGRILELYQRLGDMLHRS